MDVTKLNELEGKTVYKVEVGREDDSNEYINMYCTDGKMVRFYHHQDCCENVSIEDICGNWNDLLMLPLLVAEERTQTNDGEDGDEDVDLSGESTTWTFYTFRTVRGTVDVRWCGSSNGYYSETVDIEVIPIPVADIRDFAAVAIARHNESM